MIRTLIVDDEELARKNLVFMLNEHCPQVEVVGEASNMKTAKQILDDEEIDLLLLDIEMPNGSGFDLLEQHIGDFQFKIIFITAYHEYALKAFKFSALDYLLKPINSEELIQAINKVSPGKDFEPKVQIDHLIENLSKKGNVMDKLALPSMEGLQFVGLDDIIYCESQDNYTQFFLTTGQRVMVSKTIKYFEELLDENRFFRVHRSHIINLKYIDKYVKGEGGYIVMKQGNRIPVSRRKKEAFLQLFQHQ